MARFLIRRTLQGLFVMWLMTVTVFLIFFVGPALTPVVTQFGLDVGVLIGGAVITETVFGLPGIGYTAINVINQQDLPVVIGVVIVASAGVIIANLIVDILYAVLDPRVRLP